MVGQSIGRSVARREDGKLLNGQGAFVEDLDFPGTLWVSFVRSPHAHAAIRSIDTKAALDAPSVQAVLTGADIHPRFHTNPTVSLAFFGAESVPYYLIATEETWSPSTMRSCLPLSIRSPLSAPMPLRFTNPIPMMSLHGGMPLGTFLKRSKRPK